MIMLRNSLLPILASLFLGSQAYSQSEFRVFKEEKKDVVEIKVEDKDTLVSITDHKPFGPSVNDKLIIFHKYPDGFSIDIKVKLLSTNEFSAREVIRHSTNYVTGFYTDTHKLNPVVKYYVNREMNVLFPWGRELYNGLFPTYSCANPIPYSQIKTCFETIHPLLVKVYEGIKKPNKPLEKLATELAKIPKSKK